MASFAQLKAEVSGAEHFPRAWSLWGSMTRIFSANPAANLPELNAAHAVFEALALQRLTEKQRKQGALVLSSISALIVGCQPEEPKPPHTPQPPPDKSPNTSAYAGMRQPPGDKPFTLTPNPKPLTLTPNS